jgi:hypothetical protein
MPTTSISDHRIKNKPLNDQERRQIKEKLHKNLKNLFKVLYNEFHQFNYNMDLNINRLGNSLLNTAQQHPELFASSGQSIYPNSVVVAPVKELVIEKMINYHPIRLNFKHDIDYLFRI